MSVLSVRNRICASWNVILVGLVFAFPVDNAVASDRTVVLGYICDTYESARQVALQQGWKNPQAMPGDCRWMFKKILEKRLADIIEIVEVLSIGNDRWIEIGKVRRNHAETGYSAGIERGLGLM